MTHMSVSTTGSESNNFVFELTSISLVEDQQVPSDFIDLIESESETEAEPETEPETETEPEEPEVETETEQEETETETEETNGGIPGYHLSAIILSIGLVIVLKRKTTISP